jgi:uncharacterized protein YaiL (DUF2058 family)
MPLLSLVAGVVGSLVTFSYKYGALEMTAASNVRRIEALEVYKEKQEQAKAARLESYENARAASEQAAAAKMAEFQQLINSLKAIPPPAR